MGVDDDSICRIPCSSTYFPYTFPLKQQYVKGLGFGVRWGRGRFRCCTGVAALHEGVQGFFLDIWRHVRKYQLKRPISYFCCMFQNLTLVAPRVQGLGVCVGCSCCSPNTIMVSLPAACSALPMPDLDSKLGEWILVIRHPLHLSPGRFVFFPRL